MNRPILRARSIRKQYETGNNLRLEVLKGIDLDIRQAEIVAVTGPSGVGKSTLLHILGALDRPTAGEVFLDDRNVFSLGDEPLARFRNLKIGFVFQFHHLLPEFTALENVAMPALIARRKPQDVFPAARRLLDEIGLAERTGHKPRELSGGEQQRIAFARALVNDPVLVLADEPSGNLDLANSQSLHRMMWDMVRRNKKTFVVVTHNPELAGMADRVIDLYDGRIKNQTCAKLNKLA